MYFLDFSLFFSILKDEEREQAAVTTKVSEESASAVTSIEVLRQETVATALLLHTNAVPAGKIETPSAAPTETKDAAEGAKDVYYKDNGRK